MYNNTISIDIFFTSSGRMMWQGPNVKYRRPEARRYSMWIKDAKDNNFLRERGIRCLSDHEIGTHFVS